MFTSSHTLGSGGDDGKVPTTDFFVVGTLLYLEIITSITRLRGISLWII